MYHSLVKRLARRNFLRVNHQQFDALLRDCSPQIHHRFGGHHALGGERHGTAVLALWFARLARLFPDLRLDIEDIWVKGHPGDTTVIMRWVSAATLADGFPYRNRGVHVVRLRWGKAIAIDANEDSQAVAEALERLAALGIEEASAAPITS